MRISDFTIDDGYYKPEVLSGFRVSGIMKRAWAAQLEVLRELDRICEKHNIRWYADCGTLLGTIRHKGFIPWDDDIDVCMLREDYDQFLKVVKYECDNGFDCVNTFHEGDMMRSNVTRLVNGTSLNFSEEHLNKFHRFPYVCGIDIFPLDDISDDAEEWELQIELVKLVAIAWQQWKYMSTTERVERIRNIEELCGVNLGFGENTEKKLLVLLDALIRSGADGDSKRIASVVSVAFGFVRDSYKKSWYSDVSYLPFEGIEIPVPAEYDKVLSAMYGADYMTPVKNIAGHEYPFFSKQKTIAYNKTKPKGNVKKREEYVAGIMEMEPIEVFECAFIEELGNADKYLYFCQSEMKEIIIPNEVYN